MPSVSTKQHRAMEAAAHGNSTLGIPKKVAREYVAADEGKSFKGKRKTKERHPRSHAEFEALGRD